MHPCYLSITWINSKDIFPMSPGGQAESGSRGKYRGNRSDPHGLIPYGFRTALACAGLSGAVWSDPRAKRRHRALPET
ncbi:MAG: hypothetical protein [Olavius algarvensis Gamma 1 endosymbiont]|nr:MAG: hypothetical protein [Olavius algarvensis Gamma 1 endosymbiont]